MPPTKQTEAPEVGVSVHVQEHSRDPELSIELRASETSSTPTFDASEVEDEPLYVVECGRARLFFDEPDLVEFHDWLGEKIDREVE